MGGVTWMRGLKGTRNTFHDHDEGSPLQITGPMVRLSLLVRKQRGH